MQYVNDDMDDLSRRAAENYPLDTKSADWDKMAAELEIKPEKTKYRVFWDRRFLWLLLLLPLSFVCNHIFNAGTPVLFNTDPNGSVNISKNEQGSVSPGEDLQPDQKKGSRLNQGIINNSTVNLIVQSGTKSRSGYRSTYAGKLRKNQVTVPRQIRMTLGNANQFDQGISESQPAGDKENKKALTKDRGVLVSLNNYPFPVIHFYSAIPDPLVKGTDPKLMGKPN